MPSAAFCDLHTHSTFSDGTLTPEELVQKAKAIHLGALALTDHNTSHGLPRFLEAGHRAGLHVIPGAEISTTYNEHEVHIVALFIPPDKFDEIDKYVQILWTNKEKSNIELVRRLTDAGYPLDYPIIKAKTPSGQVNRSRIGDAIEEHGYMTKDEAFLSVLRPISEGGLYVAPARPDALATIRFIRSLGAVPVLAHPFLNFTPEQLEEFLPKAKDAGLIGMEVYYSTFDNMQTEMAKRLAATYGLLESGGSDYHGAAKKDIELGMGKGNLRVPCDLVEALASAASQS